jgi:predicted acetyltransferase
VFFDRFHFHNPGPLIDGDLELVVPEARYVDEFLAACGHPLTEQQSPGDAHITRQQLLQFLKAAPRGREASNPIQGRVPQYHFWMRQRDGFWGRPGSPEIRMVGGIGLRVGSTEQVELYYGHFGYHVYPAARGRHYAERACRLLLPLARRHGLRELWITCNPDNTASRRTCERLGARFAGIVPIPETEPLYARGEREKLRYRLDLYPP